MIVELVKKIRNINKEHKTLNEALKDYRIGVYAIEYNKSVEEIKKIVKDFWKYDYEVE